ncbi:MAG: putative metal-binding motif-containing protein [Myxococcota bacterium]
MTRLALFVLLSGCSLLGLDEFDLATCATHDDCEPLNAAEGIGADSCSRYRCSLGGMCVFRESDLDGDGEAGVACGGTDCNDDDARIAPGTRELCDGLDNDCDEVVDETVGELVERTRFRSSGAVTSAGFAGEVVAWSTSDESAWLASSDDTPRPVGYTREANESNLMQPQLVAEDECPFLVEGDALGTRCGFRTLDVAPASGSALFAAVVHDRGCPEGQLRLGRIDQLDAPRVVLRGPPVRSNLHFGIDVDWSDRPCTGASRSSGGLGATQPVIQSAGDRALALWLADSLERDVCDDTLVDLEAIEVIEESGNSGGEVVYWVTGSNSGAPQVLGEARGKAGVAAIEDGYLIGYGGADGVVLQFLSSVASPAPVSPDARFDDVRPVDPLVVPAPEQTLASESGEPVFEVVLTGGVEDRVGVLWSEGCRGALMFAVIARGDGREVFRREMAPAAESFSLASLGAGWAVAWTTAGTVHLDRVDAAGTSIDVPLELTTDVRAGSPIALDTTGPATVTFVGGDGSAVQAASLACPSES